MNSIGALNEMRENIDNNISQGIGGYVAHLNLKRWEELKICIKQIEEISQEKLSQQHINLIKAIDFIGNIKEFIGNPNKILGSKQTKHGEIAEQMQVGINNARAALAGLEPTYTFEGVGRTAPEDYLDNGQQVQSKFYNSAHNTLKGVLKHNEKYPYFGGNKISYYNIPKDQYETISKISNNDFTEKLTPKSIQSLKKDISQIEERTGSNFNEVIKPSVINYEDAQLGKANEVIDNEENFLKNENIRWNSKYKDESKKEKVKAIDSSRPSFGEAIKVAGIAAALSGGIAFSLGIAKKKKAGKKISEFSSEDWKEVGVDTAKGGAKGGITGGAIYGMTNLTKMSAPMASAYVSAGFGIANLANEYRQKKITEEEFLENSQVVCIDSAISAMGAGLGQVIIPIPVVGAVVGSIVASTMGNLSKQYLEKEEQKLIEEYNQKFMDEIKQMNVEHQLILNEIMQEYYKLGEITNMAFDFKMNANLRFEKSIELAEVTGVNKKDILMDKEQIASYFLD